MTSVRFRLFHLKLVEVLSAMLIFFTYSIELIIALVRLIMARFVTSRGNESSQFSLGIKPPLHLYYKYLIIKLLDSFLLFNLAILTLEVTNLAIISRLDSLPRENEVRCRIFLKKNRRRIFRIFGSDPFFLIFVSDTSPLPPKKNQTPFWICFGHPF